MSDGARLETAVCIVGAGAAGITLAREFAGREIDVCVVESGGLAPDDATQSLAEATTVGLPYFPLDANRVRAFGGTTALWAGWSRLLEPLDFAPRPWVPHSGWPLTAAELEPYYRRAHDVCQLRPCDYEPAAWLTRLGAQPLLDGPGILTRLYRLSPPTRFGPAYGNQLRGAPNVRVLLHPNAVELETDGPAHLVSLGASSRQLPLPRHRRGRGIHPVRLGIDLQSAVARDHAQSPVRQLLVVPGARGRTARPHVGRCGHAVPHRRRRPIMIRGSTVMRSPTLVRPRRAGRRGSLRLLYARPLGNAHPRVSRAEGPVGRLLAAGEVLDPRPAALRKPKATFLKSHSNSRRRGTVAMGVLLRYRRVSA